jgi:hypothetical protein
MSLASSACAGKLAETRFTVDRAERATRDWVSKSACVSSLRTRGALVARSSFERSGAAVSSAATVTSIGAADAA